MADTTPAPESPLGTAYLTGSFGDFADGVGATLSEIWPGSIVQVAAWPDTEAAVLDAVREKTGLALANAPTAGVLSAQARGFGIGPQRYLLLTEAEAVADALRRRISAEHGSVTDLSHGRTVLRIAGPKAEWVLSKLFAIDFSLGAFPVGEGRSTVHHDIQAQIQRTATEQFDLAVFRSFARSFWTILGHAAEEVGYAIR